MEAAFLKRITDEPDDAVARLVFADWLREQDAPALNERGEFIHLQHALAAGTVPPVERAKLVARQKELLTRYREQWEEPFRERVRNCEFRRGFAERVTLTAEQFVDGFAALAERTPVVRVRLSGLTADTVEVVGSVEALDRVRELDLSGTWVTPSVLAEFLASPHLTRLRSLNLARTHAGDDGVRALVGSRVFRRLRYLNLSRAGVGEPGVRALVNGIYNRDVALEMLVLRGAPRLEPGTFPPVPRG
ncbi:MAG: TIGR02996 domain-containing protein, partial [Planctomycetes bacterium]|nr:TIGR02996 domain-containing protein [Planctomycetota bacterium]